MTDTLLASSTAKMNISDSALSLNGVGAPTGKGGAPESKEAQAVAGLLNELTQASSEDGRKSAAAKVAAHIKKSGVAVAEVPPLVETLKAAMNDVNTPLARENALLVYAELANALGHGAEPYLVPLLDIVLDRLGDKVPAVRTAAEAAQAALVATLAELSVPLVLPALLAAMETKKAWQTKMGALGIVRAYTLSAPTQLAQSLPEAVPVLGAIMGDAKVQVKNEAMAVMTEACKVVGNRDIEQFIPVLVSCIARPAEVPDCVHKLSATTFVQQVEAPTLAILVPLLVRGLRERATAIKRKSAVITDNMAKLVDNPQDAAVFLPRLLPGLEKVKNEVADPECRNVATKAHATLQRLLQDCTSAPPTTANFTEVEAALKACLKEHASKPVDEATISYVCHLSLPLITAKVFDFGDWAEAAKPYLSAFLPEAEITKVVKAFLSRCEVEVQKKAGNDEPLEEGEELCNCEFSLAYGAKILLNNATMRLIRGQRYGLCGPNGVGKSTLMRAIANGQVDGFPPKEELRTVYVEHDIDSEESSLSVVEYIFSDPILQDASHPAHSLVEETLASVGFTETMQAQPVGSLSGGWKMKLALARAMLMKADIMLLDEPTNHLDVTNVAWLEGYLTNLPNVTSILVSHDSSFLDHVCSHIIHYEARKLRTYRGNLSEFVKVRPEAKSYYELASSEITFVLPEPGFLEGIKSKDKPILKMMKCNFKYPGNEKNTIENISIVCSLASRVAVIGPNGAGKSTMIKLLTGEMEPTEGTVWKHPNMRIAYVAQHAFHHLEQHLDKTPNQYIQWRYATGEDREALMRVDRVITDEEKAQMAKLISHDGVKKVVDKLLGRRKLKKTYEYEIRWAIPFAHPEHDIWMARDKLCDLGFEKLVTEVDMKESARMGLVTRPLTQAVVQKHLEDLGIDPEFGTHSHIRGLSGGQKVKVVLAAAMWLNPHMLVLDEPTNYLDRDSLGALATAIKTYGGGVVMISHNAKFTTTLCPESWTMAAGKLSVTGQTEAQAKSMLLEMKRQEEMTDAFGNTIKIKAPKKVLSRQEKKKAAKVRAARIARGEEVSSEEEEE